MPPVLPNEQELNLKKRARRRLVGAIALVLLMIIILPRILQDRAALAPQEAIKITMPETVTNQQVAAFSAGDDTVDPKVENDQAPQVDASAATASVKAETHLDSETANETKVEKNNNLSTTKNDAENSPSAAKVEKTVETKTADVKADKIKTSEIKVSESKVTESKAQQKNAGNFTLQVGVYSDLANVKQLQAKLKQAGYTSHAEKITTPKGEKIRLRAGNFASRQEAAYALTKLQAVGLSGMVISNE